MSDSSAEIGPVELIGTEATKPTDPAGGNQPGGARWPFVLAGLIVVAVVALIAAGGGPETEQEEDTASTSTSTPATRSTASSTAHDAGDASTTTNSTPLQSGWVQVGDGGVDNFVSGDRLLITQDTDGLILNPADGSTEFIETPGRVISANDWWLIYLVYPRNGEDFDYGYVPIGDPGAAPQPIRSLDQQLVGDLRPTTDPDLFAAMSSISGAKMMTMVDIVDDEVIDEVELSWFSSSEVIGTPDGKVFEFIDGAWTVLAEGYWVMTSTPNYVLVQSCAGGVDECETKWLRRSDGEVADDRLAPSLDGGDGGYLWAIGGVPGSDRLLSVADDDGTYWWDVERGEAIGGVSEFSGDGRGAVAVSADDRFLAEVDDGTVFLTDLDTGERRPVIELPGGVEAGLAFIPGED